MGNQYDALRLVAEAVEGMIMEEVEPGVFQPMIFACGSPHYSGEYCQQCLAECGSL
jgi:hypothetical protein